MPSQSSTGLRILTERKQLVWNELPEELTAQIIKEAYQQSKLSPLIPREFSQLLEIERALMETHTYGVNKLFADDNENTAGSAYSSLGSLALVSREWAHIVRPQLLQRLQVSTPQDARAIVEHVAAEARGDLALPFHSFVQHLLVIWAYNTILLLRIAPSTWPGLENKAPWESSMPYSDEELDDLASAHPETAKLVDIWKAWDGGHATNAELLRAFPALQSYATMDYEAHSLQTPQGKVLSSALQASASLTELSILAPTSDILLPLFTILASKSSLKKLRLCCNLMCATNIEDTVLPPCPHITELMLINPPLKPEADIVGSFIRGLPNLRALGVQRDILTEADMRGLTSVLSQHSRILIELSLRFILLADEPADFMASAWSVLTSAQLPRLSTLSIEGSSFLGVTKFYELTSHGRFSTLQTLVIKSQLHLPAECVAELCNTEAFPRLHAVSITSGECRLNCEESLARIRVQLRRTDITCFEYICIFCGLDLEVDPLAT